MENRVYVTNTFTESMWEYVNDGKNCLDMLGKVDISELNRKDLILCISRPSITDLLVREGIFLGHSQKESKIYPSPGDILYVLRVKEGSNIKTVRKDQKLSEFAHLECHKYMAMSKEDFIKKYK